MTETARHNAALDGLRGVAAMAVIWFHMTRQQQDWAGYAIPARGYLAVDFFFILSGLVIARAYEVRLANGMPVLTFIKIRLIRLYPLIVLALVLGAARQCLMGPVSCGIVIGGFLREVLLIPRLHGQMFPLDFPIWSLMFELWANILYGIAAQREAVLKAVMRTAILCGAAGIAYFAIVRNTVDGGAEIWAFWLGVSRAAFGFFLGVLLNRLLTPERVAALPGVPFLGLAVALVAAMCVGHVFGPGYDVLMITVVFPGIIVLAVKDGSTGRVREAALLAGALSYPIYVLHIVTIWNYTDLERRPAPERYAAFAVASCAVLIIGYVSWRWYDAPVRRFLSRRARKEKSFGF